MTTAYTPILKLALPVTGELSGTWGTVVNDNITSMVEQAVAGLATINTWTTNAHTLTTADGTTSESRCAMLVAADGAGGTALTGAGEIICPAASKLYVLKNGSSYAVTLKTSAGSGVAVPSGDTAFLFCDGTNVNACVTTIVNGHISGNLTVDGNTTLGDANTDTVTVNAQFNTDLLPSTDNARDLGSTAKSWRTLYCDTSVLTPLVTATNLQITNIKANDGTAAMSIADSTGAITVSTLLNVDNLRLDGNTLSSTDSNGNVVLAPNGTGDVQLDADTVRIGDSNANATITTNGTGDLILNTNSGTNSGSITIEDGVNGNIIIAPNGTGQVQITNAALDLTTIEVSNIKAKDGTAAMSIADSTGAVTVSSAFAANGGVTIGDASGDAFTINSSAVSTPNGLNFDSNTFVIDAANNRVGINNASPTVALDVTGALTISGNAILGNASTDTVQVNGYMGVGGAPNSQVSISALGSSLTGANQYAFQATIQGNSAATTSINGFYSAVATTAESFTCANLRGVWIASGAIGAGSAVTNKHGLFVSDQTGGTNNFGITSQVSSGTDKWNIYASGTANNAFAGNVRIGSVTAPTNALDVTGAMTVSGNVTLGDASTDTVTVNGYMGVGGAASASRAIYVQSTALTGTTQSGIFSSVTGSSAATSNIDAFRGTPASAAAAFTVANMSGLRLTDATKGAGSTITSQRGILIDDQTQGTNNYGIDSQVSSGANKWNIYASGTAANYFAGNVGIGTSTPDSYNVLGGTLAAVAGTGISNVSIVSGASSTGNILFADGTSGDERRAGRIAYDHSVNSLYFFTNGNSLRATIDSAGNVGIGTSAPGAKLDIKQSGTNWYDGVRIVRSTNDNQRLALGNTSGASYIASIDAAGGTNNALLFGRSTDGTTFTESARFDSSGNLGIGTTSPTNLLSVAGNANITGNTTLGDASTDTVQVNGYMGVGGAPGSACALTVASTALTSSQQFGVSGQITGSSAATSLVAGVDAYPQTANASFTTTNVAGFYARAGLKGASNTASNWHGVYISDQTQGTNNYGITSLVSSGSNKWNIYASGTANNAFAGNVRIGSTTAPTNALDVTGAMTVSGNTTLGDASTDTVQVNGYMAVGGAVSTNRGLSVINSALSGAVQSGIVSNFTATSAATTQIFGVVSEPNTAAAAFTAAEVTGVLAANVGKGAGSTITNQYGVRVADQTQGTNNFGVSSQVSSGSNKWNIYASGTASNYFAGNVGIGTSAPSSLLHLQVTTNFLSGPTLKFDLNDTGTSIDTSQSLGTIQFVGNDAQGNGVRAEIIAVTEGTSGQTGLSFGTMPAGTTPATAAIERLRIDSSGNVRVGTAALATTATDGFLYIPTCAGTPTGTPTAITGLAPMVIDSTNNKLYIYSGGAWVALN